MLLLKRLTMLAVTVGAIPGAVEPALAGLGQPSPWQLGLQQSATPVMDDIIWFHDFLLYIITGIVGFVLALLIVQIADPQSQFIRPEYMPSFAVRENAIGPAV